MHYEPIHDRVIVREIQERKTTTTGLVIPDAARKHKGIAYGEVIAVGQGRVNAEGKTVPLYVKSGDVICYPMQAAMMLPLMTDTKDDEVSMLHERDIISVVHGLPRETSIVGLDGALLKMEPQSMALDDRVYENRDGVDRSVFELTKMNAPPDVIAEVDMKDEP